MSATNILRKKATEETVDSDYYNKKDFLAGRTIRIECVLRSVSDSIEKIKISLILPKIFENAHLLPELLKDHPEYLDVIPMVQDFIQRQDFLVRTKTTALLDHRLVRMIDYFLTHHKMYKIFPNWLDSLKREERKLLSAFEMLYDIATQHLQKSAISELAKERKLHEMYHQNEGIKSSIQSLKAKLHKQKLNLRWKMAGKEVYLQKFEDDLAIKKWQNNLRIQNEIVKCTREIRNIQKLTLEKQKELEEEKEKARFEYERAMKTNMAQEREACAEKNKLLLQLQGLLKKYDQNIGEKMRENVALQEEYEAAKKKIDDFMVIYNKEEAIYAEIVLKREEEERREQQRRVILFMMNRAARKIQRYWRAWRKWQRKKAKKSGGKKGKRK